MAGANQYKAQQFIDEIKEDDKFTWFLYYLKINKELIAFILELGSDVKVEKPMELTEEIKKIYLSSLENYCE